MSVKVPEDITVYSVIPHMHLLGHDMKVTAKLPDGEVQQLVNVTNYDFNWQTDYVFRHPISLPKGTQVDLVAHYNNSADNPRNPNSPPKRVTWGEQTTDEMCIAFLSYTADAEHIRQSASTDDEMLVGTQVWRGMAAELIRMFDKNGDGGLDVDELANAIVLLRSRSESEGAKGGMMAGDPHALAQRAMLFLDRNHDGKLDIDEMTQMVGFLRGRRSQLSRAAR